MGITIFDVLGDRNEEAARERAVVRTGVLDAIGDPDLTAIVEHAKHSLGTSMAAATIIYSDWQYVIAGAGVPTGPYSRRTSFCGHAVLSPDPVFYISDATKDARFCDNPAVLDGLLRFYAGALLRDEEGISLGSLCVFDADPRTTFDAQQRATLMLLATQAEDVIKSRSTPPA